MFLCIFWKTYNHIILESASIVKVTTTELEIKWLTKCPDIRCSVLAGYDKTLNDHWLGCWKLHSNRILRETTETKLIFKWSITENYSTSTEEWKNKLWAMKCFLWEVAATNITSSFHLMHSGEISRREKQTLFCFFRKWLKGLWDKISLCSSKCWERYLLIMFLSSHCALPLMECLPLAFQRRQPIKATDDSRWCAVRSFDSFCLFESDIFIPYP